MSRAQARLPVQVSACDDFAAGGAQSQLSAGGGRGSFDFAGALITDAAADGIAGTALVWKTTERAADQAAFSWKEELWKWDCAQAHPRLISASRHASWVAGLNNSGAPRALRAPPRPRLIPGSSLLHGLLHG